MLSNPLLMNLLLAITLFSFCIAQAQTQKLSRPQNIHFENDAVVRDAVDDASGYRVELVRAASRLRYIMEEAKRNRFSRSEFYFGESYRPQALALGSGRMLERVHRSIASHHRHRGFYRYDNTAGVLLAKSWHKYMEGHRRQERTELQ